MISDSRTFGCSFGVSQMYRKPTHTDRYLDFNSHHDNRHKASTASTLLHRALSLPNSAEGKKRELNYVHAALESNGYPSKFIKNIPDIHVKRSRSSTTNVSPGELVGMFFKMVEPTESRKSFASLPYIKGVTEPLTRVLKKHDVTVVNKPFTTLQQQFPAPKFRPSMESQTNVVYKIPCTNCSWCYIGETGRAFNTRIKEHLRNTKTAAKGSRIANHAWSNNHAIDFENASIIDKGTFRTRKTLEAQITIIVRYPRNTTFFLTNIHNYLHSHYFVTRAFYSNFLIAFFSLILPVEDCRSSSRKLVVFKHFNQRSFLDFNYVSSWLRPFNIFLDFVSVHDIFICESTLKFIFSMAVALRIF